MIGKYPIYTLLLGLLFLAFGCGGREGGLISIGEPAITDTLFIVTPEAATASGKQWRADLTRIGEPGDTLTFQIGKASRITFRTRQLADHRLTFDNISGVAIDTSELDRHVITLTPVHTTFSFDIYRDFRRQKTILSYTDFNDEQDKVTTVYSVLDDKQMIGKVKMSANPASANVDH